ncbi:MAG TPA: c-type cytochrome domain-containing protein [Methylomirabilota bacterium]
MTDLALFLGRFHPVLVHLPIGFLLAAGVLELLARRPSMAGVRPVVGPVLLIGAASAVVSAGAGYLLMSRGSYGGDTVGWHRALGIALALSTSLTAAAWYAAAEGHRSTFGHAYRVLLALSLALLAVTAHLGGTLTHGEGFLTEHAPAFLRFGSATTAAPAGRAAADVVVYRDLVQPLLESRCVQCHGPDRREGELRLDGPEGIRAGGDSGAAVAAGDPGGSELIRRLWLPAGHADAMPPRGHAPLRVAEADLLRWWIAEGASFDQTLADVETPEHVEPAIEAVVGPIQPSAPAILTVDVPAAAAPALESARALGVHVSPLADGTPLLAASCTNAGAAFGDRELETLTALGPQITGLDLTGTAVTDAGLTALARFPHLTRLRLDRTAIGDAGLVHVGHLSRLESLNLYGTKVTDEGLSHLEELASLRTLYLWQTAATAAGAERLRAANPRLEVDLGISASPRS